MPLSRLTHEYHALTAPGNWYHEQSHDLAARNPGSVSDFVREDCRKESNNSMEYGLDASDLCVHRILGSALIEVRISMGDFVHRHFGLRLVSIVRLYRPASAFDGAVFLLLLETDSGYAI